MCGCIDAEKDSRPYLLARNVRCRWCRCQQQNSFSFVGEAALRRAAFRWQLVSSDEPHVEYMYIHVPWLILHVPADCSSASLHVLDRVADWTFLSRAAQAAAAPRSTDALRTAATAASSNSSKQQFDACTRRSHRRLEYSRSFLQYCACGSGACWY